MSVSGIARVAAAKRCCYTRRGEVCWGVVFVACTSCVKQQGMYVVDMHVEMSFFGLCF